MNQEVYTWSHCVAYCATLSWIWLYGRRIQWQPHHSLTIPTYSLLLLLFNRHANKTARSFFLVSEFRSTASMVSVLLPVLITLQAGRPTGASVFSRGKKCSFLQIVETSIRWVSRVKMLRHATGISPPNGLKLARPPNKQPLHDTASCHSVNSRITSTNSPSFCMIIFSVNLKILTVFLPQLHYCSFYVNRPILAPPPLWLHKHPDPLTFHFGHSADLWH